MKTRRILAIVVAAIMLVSTLALVGLLNVTAAEASVGNAEEFFTALEKGDDIKLTQAIDLTGYTTFASYSGTIDGDGKSITGITAPLFATLSGTVKNLTLEGAITTDAATAIGALANTAGGALTIEGVTNKVNITTTAATAVGGFVGEVTGTNSVTFTGCTNEGVIDATGAQGAAGFVGLAQGTSKSAHASVTGTNCVNVGAVTMTTTIGDSGAAGYIGFGTRYTAVFTRCVNEGDITSGGSGTGGFFGSSIWKGSDIEDKFTAEYCANTGNITNTNKKAAGGFGGKMSRCTNGKYTFSYCYNTGDITTTTEDTKNTEPTAGGLVAYTNDSSGYLKFTGCYNAGNLTGLYYYQIAQRCTKANSSTDTYAIGSQKVSNQNATTYTSCTNLAGLVDGVRMTGEYCVVPNMNDGYPVLKWQCNHGGKDLTDSACEYCGVAPESLAVTLVDGVYNVYTENDLLWIAYSMNAGVVPADADITLKADITLTHDMTYINKTYSGTFDGENHTLSGINKAIFNTLSGEFKNVTLEGTIEAGRASQSPIALSGAGAVVTNVHSKVNLVVESTAGDNYSGFIAYTSSHNKFENCTYSGTIIGKSTKGHFGGFTGYTNTGSADPGFEAINCVFDGTIVLEGSSANDVMVGGILAYNRDNNGHEVFTNCYSSGTITVPSEYTSAYVGGIVGYLRTTSGGYARITGCIFDGEINAATAGVIAGTLTSVCTINDCVGFTTDFPVSANGGTITNSYAGEDAKPVGNAIKIGEVTYQKYGFGYFNETTKQIVSDAQELSATVDDSIKGYIQIRDNGDMHDVRVIFVINAETVVAKGTVVTITFTKDGETVKTFTATLGGEDGDFEVFRAGIAAGTPFFAAENCEMFGAVVTGIPDGEWDTVTATIVSEETELFNKGTNYAE